MGIKLNTAKQAFPMIYAYSTPQIADHNGWTKIGYTEEQDVETRIKQQTHTSDTLAKLEWKGAAIVDDGSGESFTDKAFHAYLRKLGVANKARTEWFHIDGPTGRSRFYLKSLPMTFLPIQPAAGVIWIPASSTSVSC